jgi:pyruvate carboxylase
LYLLSNTIKLLNVLDEYEEFETDRPEESLFIREQVQVKLKEEEITTYAYIYNRPTDPKTRIASGDYMKP